MFVYPIRIILQFMYVYKFKMIYIIIWFKQLYYICKSIKFSSSLIHK